MKLQKLIRRNRMKNQIKNDENKTKSQSNFAQAFTDHYVLPDKNLGRH